MDLDEIEARANAATGGPWFRDYGDVMLSTPDPRDVGYEEPRAERVVRRAEHQHLRDPQGIADAEFIAWCRTDVPALAQKTAWLDGRLRIVLVGGGRAFAYRNGEVVASGPWAELVVQLLGRTR